ncbi:MAG: zinc ribbon domain-containing protein [Proteobacteria bacterium]|nr:zinc ribbon domain-containing protein [Pseudomonadota bacterium]
MKGKTCRACGYTRSQDEASPEGQCPNCERWYIKTDKLGESVGSGEDPNDPGLVRAQLAEARRRREREQANAAQTTKMIGCPDCAAQISARAKSCPHCGAPISAGSLGPAYAHPPTPADARKKKKNAGPVAYLVALLIIIGSFSVAFNDNNASSSSGAGTEPCEPSDAQCWFSEHSVDLTIACKPEIARRAQYQYEWTHGFLGQAFDRFTVRDDGRIRAFGDKVKFQNGFGAWQNMSYSCTFDPEGNEVIAVTVN